MDLEDYVARASRQIGNLETEKLLQRDEIRALKAEARSYREELARLKISHEDELVRVRISCQDELARVRISYQEEPTQTITSLKDELARSRRETENLDTRKRLHIEEIKALNVESRCYQEELVRLGSENAALQAERLQQDEEIRALEARARSNHDKRVRMRQEIGRLEAESSGLQEKIRALQSEALQDTPAKNVGRDVRLRYMEQHRRRMGRQIGVIGQDRINRGHRAAHRGRSLADALLCLTGEVTDRQVYRDLYGVRPEIVKQWQDVPEIIDVTGFRASLQSEGRLTDEFQTPFNRLLEIATTQSLAPTDLAAAFRENKVLQQLHGQLQNCYDKIVAANPRSMAMRYSNGSNLAM